MKRRGGWVSLRRDSISRVSASSPCSSLGRRWSPPGVVLGLVLGARLLAVDGAPAGLDQHPAAGAEHVLGHGGLHAGALELRVGVEDGQEALGHEVVDLQLVRAHAAEVVLGLGGDDRVVVLDLGVVDHAPQRQLRPGPPRTPRPCVGGVVAHQLGDRLDLLDHVAGHEARVGARVGERLVLLVELLRRGQRAAGGEAVQRVGVALQRGEVVEQLRALGLLLGLQLGDHAGLALGLLDDLRGLVLGDPLAAHVAAGVDALTAGGEQRLHQPVGLGLELADLDLSAGHQRQRGRLHAAERDRAVEGRAQADRRGAGGVHPHHPVGLRARARGVLEAAHLLAVAQLAEGLLDRAAGHRGQPQPLHGLLRLGRLVDVGEDQLALAAGVAGVDHVRHLVARHLAVDHAQLLLRLVVVRARA